MRNWLLPEYIEDVLPAEAERIEMMRRKLIDLFVVNGYELVMPPMLEYLESLITGVGHDLDLATFKVVDQLTGRLMGVRADITPQVARIDAHMSNNQGVNRFCYAGDVLRTSPDGLAQTRQPFQLGAELFGHQGIESDIEIQRLMIKAMKAIDIKSIQIDFNHVGIFNSLISKIDDSFKDSLYHSLQTKDKTTLFELIRTIDKKTADALCALTDLNGDASILDEAQKILPPTDEILSAINDLRELSHNLSDLKVEVCFDLAELRGYHYHSGLVFAAYAQGYSGPLALGGRYDEVGLKFGRARPATGFSLDLRGVVASLQPATLAMAIFAPYLNDLSLMEKIETLRAEGHKVVQELPGLEMYRKELKCDRQLVKDGNAWIVVSAPELMN